MKIKDILLETETPDLRDVIRWLSDHWDSNYWEPENLEDYIKLDGRQLAVTGDIHLDLSPDELPFEFKPTKYNFTISGAKTLKGCPSSVEGYFRIHNSKNLSSFEHAPLKIGHDGLDDYHLFDVSSLKGIHRYIKKIEGLVEIGWDVKDGGLGLLKIPGIEEISLEYKGSKTTPRDLKRVASILNNCLDQGSAGVTKAQRELIDNDLDDYAEL